MQERLLYGGEGGIRTLDTGLGYTPLAGERLQPLGHLTIKLSLVSAPRVPLDKCGASYHISRKIKGLSQIYREKVYAFFHSLPFSGGSVREHNGNRAPETGLTRTGV